MYVIIAPLQIKEGYKEQFVAGLMENAGGAVRDEPGCLRFDVIQDANDSNRIWVYEVYKDEASFQAHTQSPHYLKFRGASGDWREEGGLQGSGRGASNIWPPDNEWT
jgi:autoinducer 2-degrading protein